MNKAFVVGILLNLLFVIIEVIVGFMEHSLSLLSDAGHNLADVGALALSLLAFRMAKLKSTDKFTYGYRKTSILVALFNAMILLISIGIIVYEAVQRIFHPVTIDGIRVSVIAFIGILINFISARMFFRDKESDLNVKAAYLHLMSDALVSAGIVAGGILIFYFRWFWLDPLISIAIAIVILLGTWQVLKDSLRLSLDGVPEKVDINEIKKAAAAISGVVDFIHVHVWAMSTTENALTAQVVFSSGTSHAEEEKLKEELRHVLFHQNIHHITLETIWENDLPVSSSCHTVV